MFLSQQKNVKTKDAQTSLCTVKPKQPTKGTTCNSHFLTNGGLYATFSMQDLLVMKYFHDVVGLLLPPDKKNTLLFQFNYFYQSKISSKYYGGIGTKERKGQQTWLEMHSVTPFCAFTLSFSTMSYAWFPLTTAGKYTECNTNPSEPPSKYVIMFKPNSCN